MQNYFYFIESMNVPRFLLRWFDDPNLSGLSRQCNRNQLLFLCKRMDCFKSILLDVSLAQQEQTSCQCLSPHSLKQLNLLQMYVFSVIQSFDSRRTCTYYPLRGARRARQLLGFPSTPAIRIEPRRRMSTGFQSFLCFFKHRGHRILDSEPPLSTHMNQAVNVNR